MHRKPLVLRNLFPVIRRSYRYNVGTEAPPTQAEAEYLVSTSTEGLFVIIRPIGSLAVTALWPNLKEPEVAALFV